MKLLRPLLCLLVALAGGFVVLHSILGSFELVPLFPYNDQLFLQALFFDDVDNGRESMFPVALLQANEHVVLFPKPLYWLDNVLVAARGTLLVAWAQVASLLAAWWLATPLRQGLGLDRSASIAAHALLAALLLWSLHGMNLFWPYQAHLQLWVLAAVGGARWAARADRTQSSWARAATLGCAVVGLFSFGFGIAAFAALVGATAVRWPWRWKVTSALTAAVLFVVYWQAMAHTRLAAGMGELSAAGRIGHGALHVLYLLSHPLYKLLLVVVPVDLANVAALAVTAPALLGGGVLAWRWLRRGAPSTLAMVATLAYATGVASALTTAISRASLGNEGARADRYAVITILFWYGAVALLLLRLPRHRDRWLLAIAAATMALLPFAHVRERGEQFVGRDVIVAAEMAVLNEVTDAAAFATLHQDWAEPKLLARVVRGCRERRWSIFSLPQADWLGQNVDDVFGKRVPAITGSILSAVAAPGGGDALRVYGHAFDAAANTAPEWIVLVDTHDVIAGIAHRQHRRAAELIGGLPPGLRPELADTGFFVGYVHEIAREGLRAFAVTADGALAPLQR